MIPESKADEHAPVAPSTSHDDGIEPVRVPDPVATPGSVKNLPWWGWLAVLIGLAIFLWFMLEHFLQVPPV